MDLELIKSYKTTNTVVVKYHVKEKEVVISKINLSNIYGIFRTDFSPLVLIKMMIGNIPRNSIKYKFPFITKTPYVMCLENDTSIVQLTNNDINRLEKSCAWLCDIIIMCFLRWISLQSNKIAVVDSLLYLNETWNKKSKVMG